MREISIRFKDNETFPFYDREAPNPGWTFSQFLHCELGFGARIIELSPTRIHSETRVLGCVDTVIIEGTETEMRPFIQAAFWYHQSRKQLYKLEHIANLDKLGDALQELKHVDLMDTAIGMMAGERGVRLICIAMLMDGKQSRYEQLSTLRLEDLRVMLELKLYSDVPFDELLELAA